MSWTLDGFALEFFDDDSMLVINGPANWIDSEPLPMNWGWA